MDSDQKKVGMEGALSKAKKDQHNPKRNNKMFYYFYDINNKTLIYDKTTESYLGFASTDIHSLDFRKAINDKNGCTLYLHEHWSEKKHMGYYYKLLIETGRISHIEYVYGVKTSSPEDFGKNSDKEKNISPIKCLRIQLADKPQSEVLIRGKECNAFFPVPYDVIRENHVLSPERYPSQEELLFEGETEPMSKHISIVEYTGNAPDILTEIREDLRGIDDLPPVIDKNERPKYALKIDLNYWLPEGVQHRWRTNYKAIMFGTAPGSEGLEYRLNHFINLNLPPPPPLLDQIGLDYFKSSLEFSKESFKMSLGEDSIMNNMLRDNYANIIEKEFNIDFGDAFDSQDSEEKERKERGEQTILELRRNIDNLLVDIFQQQDNVSSKTLFELSNQLKRVLSVKEKDGHIYSYLIHDIDSDRINRIILILDVIVKTKELLSGDCSATLEEACPECRELLKFDDLHGRGFFPNVCNVLLKSILGSYSDKYVISHNTVEALNTRAANIRAEERQNTLYEMSHHIKNLVVTVNIHLKKLSKTIPEKDQRYLKSAMRGADKIRKLVYLITNSSRLTVDDFLYDLSSPDGSHQTLGSLFEEALCESVENMFDKETHGKYMMAFYPSLDAFENAEKDWFKTNNLADVIAFMEKQMNLKVDFRIDPFKKIVIGDTKQSATYLSVLLGELTLNMLKALAFVPSEDRVFSVLLSRKGKLIRFLFKNSYVSEMGSGTGYGKTIVGNITKGWGGGEPLYIIEKGIFEVEIQLPFYK